MVPKPFTRVGEHPPLSRMTYQQDQQNPSKLNKNISSSNA